MDAARAGRVLVSVERWVDESTTDRWERLDRACREMRRECVVWLRDWGSVVLSDDTGKVESRLRYVSVVESFNVGGGRGEGGLR